MKHLPFRSFPWHLRAFAIVVLVSGAARTLHWVIAWFAGGERPPGVLGALITAVGAFDLVKGKREGLLWIGGLTGVISALVIYGLATGTRVDGKSIGILAFVLTITGYAAWCWFRVPWKERGSVAEWLTNPEVRASAGHWFAVRNRVIARDAVTPPDPDELVAELLDEDQLALHRLRALRETEPVQAALQRALADPHFQRSEFAAEHIVAMLDPARLAACRELVAKALNELPENARENLLGEFAALGDESFAKDYAAEMERDANPWCIASGLAKAAVGGRVSDRLADAVIPGLRARLGAKVGGDYCAIALAHLEPGFVSELLDRAEHQQEHTDDALRALAEFGVHLPQHRIDAVARRALDASDWAFAATILPHATLDDKELERWLEVLPEHFGDGWCGASLAYGAILERMVEQMGARSEPFLRRALAIGREHVCDRAGVGLAMLAGLPDDVLRRLDDDAPPPVAWVRSLYEAYWKTRNGGLFKALGELDPRSVRGAARRARTRGTGVGP